jgi:beta-N-acetylhexosaminidase
MKSSSSKIFLITIGLTIFLAQGYFNRKDQVGKIDYISGSKNLIKSEVFYTKENFDEKKLKEVYINSFISNLTIEEKVGQIFMWRASGKQMTSEFAGLLRDTHAGGVIIMGDNVSPSLKSFTSDIQNQNTKIPLLIAIDQEGGVVKRIQTDTNPGAPSLAKMDDNELCKIQKNTADTLKQLGINLNFGIVADIAFDTNSFIASRAFGSDPKVVAQKVSESVKCEDVIFTTVKHFPGHGRTSVDSHNLVPIIDTALEEWKSTDALPFASAIKNNVDFVMTGHLDYKNIDDKPASLSQIQIRNLRDLGFEGIIITDDMDMLDSAGLDPFMSLDAAIRAGNNILLYVGTPRDPRALYSYVVGKVRTGEISEGMINESLKKIFAKKFELLD